MLSSMDKSRGAPLASPGYETRDANTRRVFGFFAGFGIGAGIHVAGELGTVPVFLSRTGSSLAGFALCRNPAVAPLVLSCRWIPVRIS